MQLINSALKFLECRESEPPKAAVILCVNGAEALKGDRSVCWWDEAQTRRDRFVFHTEGASPSGSLFRGEKGEASAQETEDNPEEQLRREQLPDGMKRKNWRDTNPMIHSTDGSFSVPVKGTELKVKGKLSSALIYIKYVNIEISQLCSDVHLLSDDVLWF